MSAAGSALKYLKNHGGDLFNYGTGVAFGISTYQEKREEGNGILSSVAHGAMDTVLPLTMGVWPYMALQVASGLPSMAMAGVETYGRYKRQLGNLQRNHAFQTANFSDTEQAFTMRQAGMNIAKRSKYNIQQAMLGNEAKYMLK